LAKLGEGIILWYMSNESNSITMNVSLPEPLKRYVDDKVSSGIYGSASEFVREAIREKLQRERAGAGSKDLLTQKLLDGLDSGKPIASTDDYIARKKQALVKRFRTKNRDT
jgi:antitoxin ParD1/3/4